MFCWNQRWPPSLLNGAGTGFFSNGENNIAIDSSGDTENTRPWAKPTKVVLFTSCLSKTFSGWKAAGVPWGLDFRDDPAWNLMGHWYSVFFSGNQCWRQFSKAKVKYTRIPLLQKSIQRCQSFKQNLSADPNLACSSCVIWTTLFFFLPCEAAVRTPWAYGGSAYGGSEALGGAGHEVPCSGHSSGEVHVCRVFPSLWHSTLAAGRKAALKCWS